ncbi:MAG: hypothetical protein HQK54_12910 [Oligoflexales bacterium]|nr:hypothetical protein [Oligoflexales bacterium]
MMFWSEFENYRSVGNTPFPEDQRLTPAKAVSGGRYKDIYPTDTWNKANFDNGGSWLMSVFRLSGDRLIGFVHCEYHWYEWSSAHKSIAVSYSNDNGLTWSKNVQILTGSDPVPDKAGWGGIGDFNVVKDEKTKRWVMYFGGGMAVSSDPEGKPGTWFKYLKGSFSSPGLGGGWDDLPGIQKNPGANFSVHWNTYLGKWVAVWGGWDSISYISASDDMINWETPRVAARSALGGGRAWYPNIIGETDLIVGQNARLYYSDISDSTRKFMGNTIRFVRND